MRIEVDSEILFYAFRYALGRRTYAVSDVANSIFDHIQILPDNDLYNMYVEIDEAIKSGNAGMDMDVREWNSLHSAIGKELYIRGYERYT